MRFSDGCRRYISRSVADPEEMLVICLNYANKRRFEYTIIKCLVVVFNELKSAYLQSSRAWNFGNSCIEERTEYKHLGVICDKYMFINENGKLACNKYRSTFISLVNWSIYEDGIYNSVVLPKA